MKWIERRFKFDFPAEVYPELLVRLDSTPNRLKELIANIPREILTRKSAGSWSIQENAGHLITVENLFLGRLDDYEARLKKLRPAKVDGSRTDDAAYNEWPIEKILTEFELKRDHYLNRLKNHQPEFFERMSWHPRLDQPMRVCDMLYFQAEHDDHHLATIFNDLHFH
ncbi:MAG: DinB family protein [bacterium]|nr:MAG: DinB family protein [bacterium]